MITLNEYLVQNSENLQDVVENWNIMHLFKEFKWNNVKNGATFHILLKPEYAPQFLKKIRGRKEFSYMEHELSKTWRVSLYTQINKLLKKSHSDKDVILIVISLKKYTHETLSTFARYIDLNQYLEEVDEDIYKDSIMKQEDFDPNFIISRFAEIDKYA